MQPENKHEAEALAALEFEQLKGIDINKLDGRFFPGHFWITEKPGDTRGLCMPGRTEGEAVEKYFLRELTWDARGTTFTAWAQKDANSEPVKVNINW